VSAAHARPAARAPFASVWFDCDSTLSTIEGIDELARARPECAAAIAELTRRAMDGAIPLQQVYGERLRRIAPTRAEVEALARRYVATLVPGARETVAALRRLGKTVGIVSGGLRPAVLAVAHELSIPAEHVHAVDVRFAADGGYAGFDAGSPLARSGGKRDVMAALPAALQPAALVGDGMTDLEAKGAVACFVGFGGVVRRASVEAEADAFVPGPSLTGVLDVLLTAQERAQLDDGGRR